MSSTERTSPPPTQIAAAHAGHLSAVAAGVLLAVGGWSGMLWLISNQLPTVPNRWAFYALLHVALTGTALPFIRLLHQRFSRQRGIFIGSGTLVRQAVWIGLLGTTFAWLRIPRLLSLPLAVVLILAIIIIEALLRLRERMQWHPE